MDNHRRNAADQAAHQGEWKRRMITGPIKVQLRCKALKRYKLRYDFYDHGGVAVGNTYLLDELGDARGPHEWEIIRVFDGEKDNVR